MIETGAQGLQGSLDPARDKNGKQVKLTRTSTRQAPPFEDDASDSEVDIGRLESQSVSLAFSSSILLTSLDNSWR